MKTIFAFLILTASWFSNINTIVYEALKSGTLTSVENALKNLKVEKASSLNSAYTGALLMKKADFLKVPAKKVKVFKQGHQLLEAEIAAFPENIEYRFLRLAIQENAPKILKYNKNIDEDKNAIIDGYKLLDKKLKTHIWDFAEKSTLLSTTDLKD